MSRLVQPFAFVVALTLGACASTPMGQADLLAFLKPGATSRQEAIEKLGHPNAEYEHGRIQTFWIAADEGGYRSGFIEVGTTHQFSLVLVFDEKDLLVRHALVRVRGR